MTDASLTRTRAGRLRLVARLELARRGTDLLHSKEEALQRERARLEGHVARTKQEWERCCREAAAALLLARAFGASDEIRSATTRPGSAGITPHWQTSMGVTYPGVVDAKPGPEPTVFSTSALRPAADAYRFALTAAADHGSTTTALDRLTAELSNTRRRRRAIEMRLLPRLETAIRDLDLHLDEQDRDEAFRVRIASKQRQGSRQR